MTLEEELQLLNQELKKNVLLNNDLIDKLRKCELEIAGKSGNGDCSLLEIQFKALARTLNQEDFSSKIKNIRERIRVIEMEINGVSRMGRNSPFPL